MFSSLHIHIMTIKSKTDIAMNYRESLQMLALKFSGYAYYLMDPSVVGSDNTENIVSKELSAVIEGAGRCIESRKNNVDECLRS